MLTKLEHLDLRCCRSALNPKPQTPSRQGPLADSTGPVLTVRLEYRYCGCCGPLWQVCLCSSGPSAMDQQLLLACCRASRGALSMRRHRRCPQFPCISQCIGRAACTSTTAARSQMKRSSGSAGIGLEPQPPLSFGVPGTIGPNSDIGFGCTLLSCVTLPWES